MTDTQEIPSETQAEPIKFAAQCTRCKCSIVLTQGDGCPKLAIDKWLKIVVCNRCGKYLEAYRRIDDAVSYVCGQFMLARKSSSIGQIRAALSEQLTRLTQEFNRILMKRWSTTSSWSTEIVELLLDKPDKTRIVLRMEEKNHRQARELADSGNT
jgi:hypothetical protein